MKKSRDEDLKFDNKFDFFTEFDVGISWQKKIKYEANECKKGTNIFMRN